MESLNINEDNENGKFVATASVNENKFIINTTKTYNLNYCKGDEWTEIADFLDTAYEFSNKMLLILKI